MRSLPTDYSTKAAAKQTLTFVHGFLSPAALHKSTETESGNGADAVLDVPLQCSATSIQHYESKSIAMQMLMSWLTRGEIISEINRGLRPRQLFRTTHKSIEARLELVLSLWLRSISS